MTTAMRGVLALVEELVSVLDEEIALLTLRRGQMERLSALLVERDEDGTEQVLEEMERAQQRQLDADRKLLALRNALANALGCPGERLRLADLLGRLPEDVRATVDYRREQLVLLLDAFRRQHLQTSMQLLESMKINRMLLDGLFGTDASLTTYDMRGAAAPGPAAGLVDAEL